LKLGVAQSAALNRLNHAGNGQSQVLPDEVICSIAYKGSHEDLQTKTLVGFVNLLFRQGLLVWGWFQKVYHRCVVCQVALSGFLDRKSTRLNSSHVKISYAVF